MMTAGKEPPGIPGQIHVLFLKNKDEEKMRNRAIILKKQAVNEYDELITCYTEEFGRLTATAKSILKPGSVQAMHLDLFNLVDFDLISGRAYPIITGAQAENSFSFLKGDIKNIAMAYFFAEVADKLFFDYQRDDELWRFFVSLMEDLNKGRADAGYFKNKQVEFLNILGYAPNLEEYAPKSLKLLKSVLQSRHLSGSLSQE